MFTNCEESNLKTLRDLLSNTMGKFSGKYDKWEVLYIFFLLWGKWSKSKFLVQVCLRVGKLVTEFKHHDLNYLGLRRSEDLSHLALNAKLCVVMCYRFASGDLYRVETPWVNMSMFSCKISTFAFSDWTRNVTETSLSWELWEYRKT